MRSQPFADRAEAGEALGAAVAALALVDPVVLGLPRGGVPVAAKVAEALHAPLDVIVVRKLGVPWHQELAMGAVGEDGAVVLNEDVIRSAGVSERDLARVRHTERAELQRRLIEVRTVRAGATRGPHGGARRRRHRDGRNDACRGHVARASGAQRVVVAAPVAPPDTVFALTALADDVVCLVQPDPFWAVGSWYERFEAVTDAQVLALLTGA